MVMREWDKFGYMYCTCMYMYVQGKCVLYMMELEVFVYIKLSC